MQPWPPERRLSAEKRCAKSENSGLASPRIPSGGGSSVQTLSSSLQKYAEPPADGLYRSHLECSLRTTKLRVPFL